MTKNEIIKELDKWDLKRNPGYETSGTFRNWLIICLDKLITSVPSKEEPRFGPSSAGYNRHCAEVIAWKKKQFSLKEGDHR